MEDTLGRLLVPDTNVVEKATEELREIFKKPESSAELFQLMISSEKPMIRQYAAILLKERYSKSKNWSKLPPEIRARAKELMTHSLIQETQETVRNSLTQLIGAIMKHEISNNGWPQIFQLIQELATSSDQAKKELGMYTLVKITEISTDCYIVHRESIMRLMGQVMQSTTDLGSPVAFYVLKTMQNFAPFVEGDQLMVNTYHEMMIPAMNIVEALTTKDETRAVEAIELFDELCEEAMTVVGARVRELVVMCLAIAKNQNFGDELRSRALSLLNTLIKMKKKAIVKHRIVKPIVDVLWELMSEKCEEDQDFFTDENEEQSVSVRAVHTIHLLGIYFQPNKLVPHLIERIYPAIGGEDDHAKKAAYLTIAALAEGCPEYIRTHCLLDFVQRVHNGMASHSSIVRNAAYYATANLSEYLQPEISQYADQFIPMLFRYLDQVYALKDPSDAADLPHGMKQIFYAVETYCENLEEGLLPYLPNLMQKLLNYLNSGTSIQLRKLVFSAIGAIANATKDNMLPYFQDVMRHLDVHLTEQQTEETMPLQIQAVDTLGVLIRSIGGEHLKDVVERSVPFGLHLLASTVDPDVKTAVYELFAAVSTVMKKDMAPVLPKIVEYMVESVRSTEGVVTRYKDDETSVLFPLYDEGSDNDEEDIENTDNEEDTDDEDIAGYRVNTSYIEEKEEAILALRDIAESTEEAFLPYIEKCFEEVFRVTNHPHLDVRVAAINALVQFCLNLSKINTNEGKAALQKALSIFIPKLAELVRLDNETAVVLDALGAYTSLLKEIKGDVLICEGHRDAIINCVFDVMTEKTECQDPDDAAGNDSENESEEDEQLFEYAGDVFVELGKVIPSEDFTVYFGKILPKLEERCKPNKTEAQRSFAFGTIAECIVALKNASTVFARRLYTLFSRSAEDTNPEVRNNVFYGLGELILQSKEAMFSEYKNILAFLEPALARETDDGPRDNIIGVFARMIIANHAAVEPIESRFSLVFEHLPLRQDFEEYRTIFDAILTLYQAGHYVVKEYLPKILSLAINVLHENKAPNDETKESIVKVIKAINTDFTDVYNAVTGQLPTEVIETLMRI